MTKNNGRVVIVGCGNVGAVAIHKMTQRLDIFREIYIVNQNAAKASRVRESVFQKTGVNINLTRIFQMDFSVFDNVEKFFRTIKPDLVINLGPPYWNLVIMRACLKCGVHYLDTACYENLKEYGFSNEKQLAMHEEFKNADLMAQLQCGFDPGVTNNFVAYVLQESILDEIASLDILDCNAGKKNATWAPNFDPEINIRELVLPIRAIHNGQWTEHGRLIDKNPIHFEVDFPEAGTELTYLLYHEELESLHKSFPGIKRMRFWMTFSREYLDFLRVLHTVGMTRIDKVWHDGHWVIPVKFLKELLPKGEEYNESYTGKTNIGCIMKGFKDGKEVVIYIYQVCNHRKAFLETDGNAIGYTTAVPAVVGAIMMLNGTWFRPGVYVPENNLAKPFLEELASSGLPWKIEILPDLPEFLKRDFQREEVERRR